MLKSTLTHPEILAALGSAGHGSQILIADGNYPFTTGSNPAAEIVFLNLTRGFAPVDEVLRVLVDAVPIEAAHVMMPEEGPEPEIFAAFRRILPAVKVVVLGFVQREQGLFLPKGNPKGIRGIADLAREDVAFINRQRGAGTRVLLDYLLRQANIDPSAIQGYHRQEFTHLAVAAAVASGAADCGLGILGAARALDLDFIPIGEEQYDLIIPAGVYEGAALAPLLSIIRDPAFARRVIKLGGYGTPRIGQVLAELGDGPG